MTASLSEVMPNPPARQQARHAHLTQTIDLVKEVMRLASVCRAPGDRYSVRNFSFLVSAS